MGLVRICKTLGVITPLLIMGVLSPAQQNTISEYQVKAVFLFNFTQFVDWPANTFPESNAPLIIGILGKDPFGNYLDTIVLGEKMQGHAIIIQRYNTIEEVKSCHILFINLEQPKQLEKALSEVKGQSILTVGENANFIRQGGTIRFLMVNNKIRLQINPEAAKDANLSISSKLLRLAEVTSSKN